MKILVLGGTGAIGAPLVQKLSHAGIETFVTTRFDRAPLKNVNYLIGNAHDKDFLLSLLDDDWDSIIDFLVYSSYAFQERVDYLLKATKHYLFMSSARVYSQTDKLIEESSSRLLDISMDEDFLATDEYSLAKARQEDMLRNSGFKNWTIIRPYITYHTYRLQLGVLEKEDWLYRALKGRSIVFSKDILTKFTTLTHSIDVANCLYQILGNEKTHCQTYQIASAEFCKWEDVLNLYLDVIEEKFGFRPKVLLQDIDGFIAWNGGRYQVYYDRLFDRKFRCAGVKEFCDVQLFDKIDKGLRKCMLDFLDSPTFKPIDWKKEALKDRLSKEHASIKEINGLKPKVRYLFYRYLG